MACYISYAIALFVSNRKYRVMVEDEPSTPRNIQAGEPQGSVLAPTLYNLYINDTPQTPGVYLALFADDTYIYKTDRKEAYVFRKLQRCLASMESCCERWNIKINDDSLQNYAGSRQVILNHKNVNILITGQGEDRQRKYKRLKLVAFTHTMDLLCRQWLYP
jgi:hypothetical protein